jgi:hypothetical protein
MPNVSQGTMNKSYVSAIDFLDQRDIDPNLYDISRDGHFTDIMRLIGRYKPAKMFNYHLFTNADVWETSSVSAVTSTGLAQITFTVNTHTGYPRVGDVIKTSNVNNVGLTARIQSLTTASGTATLTVRTPNNVPFYATIGDLVSYGSNAYGEKSDAPTNRRYGMTKYFNLIQEFREVDEITDIQKVAKIEVEINGDYHMLPYQILQKQIYMQGVISTAMIAGVQSVTLFNDANPFLADAAGNPIQTTGGLDWYTTTYGITDTVATLGSFNFTDFDGIIDNWLANKAPLQQLAFTGTRPKRITDKFFKNLGSSGVTSVRINLAPGNDKNLNFEVDQVQYGNSTVKFVPLNIVDHPQLFGPTITPDINGSMYMVPDGKIQVQGGGMEPYIQCRHTPSPFMGGRNAFSNGIITEWRTGALAEVPTNDILQLRTNWVTYQGLEITGAKHLQKVRFI